MAFRSGSPATRISSPPSAYQKKNMDLRKKVVEQRKHMRTFKLEECILEIAHILETGQSF